MKNPPTYKCLKCGDIVESSPIRHKMNWCSCRAVGVDDHSNGYSVGVSGDSENMAFLKNDEFIKCSELGEQQQTEEMKGEMESFDLFDPLPDHYDWWDGLVSAPLVERDTSNYEHPCGCGDGHLVRTYRDCCHEYDGWWWRCYCLIGHLLLKFEGGESNVDS